jgi:hypothetical protein
MKELGVESEGIILKMFREQREPLLNGKSRIHDFDGCKWILDTIFCLLKPENFLDIVLNFLVLLDFTRLIHLTAKITQVRSHHRW